jgi:hypothetical protein
VLIGTEPGTAAVEPSAYLCPVIVQHTILAVNAAGQLDVRNLYLGFFVTRNARVGDGNSPEHGRIEIGWLGDRTDVV